MTVPLFFSYFKLDFSCPGYANGRERPGATGRSKPELKENGMKRKFILPVLTGASLMVAGLLHGANAQTVTVYQTNPDQSKLLAQQSSVSFGSGSTSGTVISVNPATQYQQMDGFGASFTDSSTYLVYNKLSASQQSALMQSLFSSTNGIGLSFLRQPMGASDFSAQGNFSYDDTAGDTSLANFSIAKDLTYTIPVLKQAFAVNPNIKVQMLPWSPPAWMKQSGTMNGGNFNDTYFSTLAQYFVKTINAYKAQGIPVYAVAAQNEPENSNSSYPTETFSSAEEGTFIGDYLGPALSSAGLSAVKIFGYEHNWNDINYPETILGNSAANPYTAGTSWHCYGGANTAMTTVQNAYPSKGTWFTECSSNVDNNFGGDLGWDMENLVIGAPNNWAKAVSEWNLALDQNSGPTNGGCGGCRGFVTINDSGSPSTITYNVDYYAYGHAAKFVSPGAYRIASNGAGPGSGGVEATAYKNPNGSIALVAYNSSGSSSTFEVQYSPTSQFFSYTLPGGGVATFTWTPSTGSAPSAPSGLSAIAASSSQINLSWTASSTSGVTYTIFRSTTSGFTASSSNQIASGVTGTTYSNTGLSASTTYYYLVEATNANGSSGPSNQASATTSAASGGSGSISTTSWYQVINKTSGMCLTDTNSSTANGTSLTQSPCVSGQYNQQWQFHTGTGGYYVVYNANATSLVWDDTNGSTSNGNLIQLYQSYSNNNQQWLPTQVSTGIWTIKNLTSGLCLDDTNGSTSSGQQYQQWACSTGNANQQYTLTAVR